MYKSVLWMFAMIASVCLMAVAGRELSASYTTAQVLFIRGLIGVAVIGSLALYYRSSIRLDFKILPTHILRNLVHFAGQYGWFYAIAVLPLAEVIAIEFTAPLFVLLLASIFLGETLTVSRVIAVVVAFIGVMFVVKPGFETVELATYGMLLTAFFYAVTTVSTKKLAMTQTPLMILLMMVVIQLPISYVLVDSNWREPTHYEAAMLVVVGLSALSAHYCFSRAMAIAEAMTVVTIDYLRLPIMVMLGWLLYGEQLDTGFLLGALLIVAANLLSHRRLLKHSTHSMTRRIKRKP